MKQRWLRGNKDNLIRESLIADSTAMYINMAEDGTWKGEYDCEDQIIALATQLEAAKKEIAAAKVTALATATDTNTKKPKAGGSYSVAPWRLVHKGDTIEKGKLTYHWCTEDHWSGGVAHQGMYAVHAPGEHAAWRAELDAKSGKGKPATKQATVAAAAAPVLAPAKGELSNKLALSESLRTALSTHTGLSSDLFEKIWDQSCKDSGNA